MPALYSIGQHTALEDINAKLQSDEHLLAYFDDIYIICYPERVVEVFEFVAAALEHHTGIRINLGNSTKLMAENR